MYSFNLKSLKVYIRFKSFYDLHICLLNNRFQAGKVFLDLLIVRSLKIIQGVIVLFHLQLLFEEKVTNCQITNKVLEEVVEGYFLLV